MLMKFTHDGSDVGSDYAEHSGQIVGVSGAYLNDSGEPLLAADEIEHLQAYGECLRKITAKDGWVGYAWDSELSEVSPIYDAWGKAGRLA